MMSAAEQIRSELGTQTKERVWRGWVLLALWTLGTVALVFLRPPREGLGPPDAIAQAIAAAFILFGASLAFTPGRRFGVWSARAIGIVAVLSPILAARALGNSDSVFAGAFACMGSITGIGFVALVVGRLTMGRTRRRFGGAPLLQAVAAGMVGSLAVGLHCPMPDVAHLATHAAGVFVVVALLRRFTLPES